jgi:arabinosyltransferase A/arabinosyltransferase B/arabinosyltransferase C
VLSPLRPQTRLGGVGDPRRPGRTPRLVLVLGVVAALAAVAFPFAPVRQPQVTYAWTPADGTAVALPLLPYQPLELVASVSCAVARTGGLLLATVPPEPDPAALPLDGLRLDGTPAGVRVTSGGADLGTVPLPPGDCTVVLASHPDRTVVALDGVPVREHLGDVRPAVAGVFTDVAAGPGPALSLTADTRFATRPTPLKLALAVVCLAALAALLVVLARADRARGTVRVPPGDWWRPRPVDGAVAGLLAVWWLVGSVTVDDGYLTGIIRTRDENGFVGNVYRWLNAPEAPFSWFSEPLRLWSAFSSSTGWMRLPSTLLGLVCWALLSRLLLPRLGAAGRRRGTAWVAALAFLTWWVPLNLGLRPEPWVAAGSLAVFLAVERAVATRAVLPVAVALLLAGATTAVTPAGLMGFAPVLAAAVPLLRLLRTRTDLHLPGRLRVAVPAAIVVAPSTAALLLMAADQSLGALAEAVRVRGLIGGGLPWYREYERYALLLAPDDVQGGIGRRAAVLSTVLAAAGVAWVLAGRRTCGTAGIAAGPARRLLVTLGLSAVALTFSPTKWTQHFGDLAGLGAAALTLGLVAFGRAGTRRTGGRVTAGLAGVALVGGLVLAGQNMWPFVSGWYTPTFSTVPPLVAGVPAATLFLAAVGAGAGVLLARSVWGRSAPDGSPGPPVPRWVPAPAAPLALVLVAVLGLQVLSLARVAVTHRGGYTPAADVVATLGGDPCGLQSALLVETDPAAGVLPARPGPGLSAAREVTVDLGGTTAPGIAVAGVGGTPWYALDPRQRDGALPVVVTVDHGAGSGLTAEFGRAGDVVARVPVPGAADEEGPVERRLVAPPGADAVRLAVRAPADATGTASLPRAPVLTPMARVLPPGTRAILDWPVAFAFPCLEAEPLPPGTASVARWRVAPPADDPSASITYTPALGGPFAAPRLLVTERRMPTYLPDDPTRDGPRLLRWEPMTPLGALAPTVEEHDVPGWHAENPLRVPKPLDTD